MNDERAALVAAIRAAPDDDAPRLVMADWFDERGDADSAARAEFIRLSVARARLADDDPRQSETEARELRLLKRHATAWCGSHFAFRKCLFRRGFIEYVHVHLTHFLHHRRQLLALEPVRDFRLTGWHRAPDDLVRRVAACEEWRHVETLRIHHQGPHKDPRGNVLTLLESPHLTGLKTLRLPSVQWNADERRRFERLAVPRRVEELTMPTLEVYPATPGEWFAEGGPDWAAVRRLTTPRYVGPEFIIRLSAAPFWPRLEGLDASVRVNQGALRQFGEVLPAGLRELTLSAYSHEGDAATDAFFAALAAVPLRALHLRSTAISVAALAGLLGPASACRFKDLSVDSTEFSPEHVRVLAGAAGLAGLRKLSLTGVLSAPEEFGPDLALPDLRGLVRLDLRDSPLGTAAVRALTACPDSRLRELDLIDSGLRTEDLQAFVESPAARSLATLQFGETHPEVSSLKLTPDLARRIIALPHLARLIAWGEPPDTATLRILKGHDGFVYSEVTSDGESWSRPAPWLPEASER